MNIIEAVKSGLPFKQKKNFDALWYPPDGEVYGLTKREILADDWEVKEEVITITKRGFMERMVEAEKVNNGSGYICGIDSTPTRLNRYWSYISGEKK